MCTNNLRDMTWHDNELVKKAFLAQHKIPFIGKFSLIVKQHFNSLKISQAQLQALPWHEFKKSINSNATIAAFEEKKVITGKA